MSTSLSPNLMTDDVNESVAFYCDRLGFQVQLALPQGTQKPLEEYSPDIPLQFAMLNRNGVMLMIQERASLAEDCPVFADMPIAASVSFYLEVEDLGALLPNLADVEILVPDRTTFYGMREIWFRDNDGYIVTLAQKVA